MTAGNPHRVAFANQDSPILCRMLCAKAKNQISKRDTAPPVTPIEELQGLKGALVIHLGRFTDPVTQIDMGQAMFEGLVDLAEYGIRAQRAAFESGGGVEEGIDGREPMAQQVDGGYGEQFTVETKLQQPRIRMIEREESPVLLMAGRYMSPSACRARI